MRYAVLFMITTLLLAGCTTRHVSEVSAFSDISLQTCCAYVLIPADRDVDVASADWQSLRRQMNRALAERGFHEAATRAEAEIAITVAAGVGESRIVERSAPARNSDFTSAATSAPGPSNNDYRLNNDALSADPAAGINPAASSASLSSRVRDRWLLVRAYDLSQATTDARFAESWRTVVRSTGSSSDLTAMLPYLVAAGAPYFGETLYETVNVSLPEGSIEASALTD